MSFVELKHLFPTILPLIRTL